MSTPLVADRSGEGPPVVLLHGQPGSAWDWQWVVPRIATEHRVIVPDRPGYGRTGGEAIGFAGNAGAVIDLLKAEEVDRAVLVGHSWAGGVALSAAETYPDQVAGLVLVSSVGPGERMGWDDRLLAAPLVGELIAGLTIGMTGRLLGSERVQQAAGRRLHGPALDAVRAIAGLNGTRPGTRVWRSFVIEQRVLLEELEMLGPRLGSISVPVEIIHGQSDRIVPPAVGELLAGAIPGAHLTVIPRAGHLLPHDHPEAVADGVRRVWARAGVAGGGVD